MLDHDCKKGRGCLSALWLPRLAYVLLFFISCSLFLTNATVLAQQEHNNTLTAVTGVKVGHYTLSERPTGCTVVLVEGGAVAGVDVRGAAPGTRETDLLNPINLVEKAHAI